MQTPAGRSSIGYAEAVTLSVLFALLLALRVEYDLHSRFDSDEPQYLHVAWAWTQGLVQYRDVFDNHTPLFFLLSAPVVRGLGERADIVVLMRLAMLPLAAVVLWQTYAIAAPLFGRATACWTALLLALTPLSSRFFEYRPLALWLVLWLATIRVLIGGRLTPWRLLAAGLLVGVAIGVLLKTVMMIAALAGAGALLLVYHAPARRAVTPAAVLGAGAMFVLGMLVMPSLLAGMLIALGAWPAAVYCTVTHNIVPGEGRFARPILLAVVPLCVAALPLVVRWFKRKRPDAAGDTRVLFLLLLVGAYICVLCIWPIITMQTVLPVWPLFLVLLVGLLSGRPIAAAAGDGPVRGRPSLAVAVGVAAAVMSLNALLGSPFRDRTQDDRALTAQALRLTQPDDYVMDCKGETVFRRRSFYYVLETLTSLRLRLGLITDTIAERCRATRTCVVVKSMQRFPRAARTFVLSNYVCVGQVYVPGRVLGDCGTGKAATFHFTLAIPTQYQVIAAHGPVAGALDGSPYTGPRQLAAGPHTFVADPDQGVLAVVWSRAIEEGYRPAMETTP
jgi:MFS family permease